MSWVVPTVAAELWGVSVEHVLGLIQAGRISARDEFGFTWVDYQPGAVVPPARARRLRRRRQRPQTYMRRQARPVLANAAQVTCQELWMLGDMTSGTSQAGQAPNAPANPQPSSDSSLEEMLLQATEQAAPSESSDPPEPDECESPEDPDDGIPMNWREVRAKTATIRRRPGQQ